MRHALCALHFASQSAIRNLQSAIETRRMPCASQSEIRNLQSAIEKPRTLKAEYRTPNAEGLSAFSPDSTPTNLIKSIDATFPIDLH